MRKIDSLTCILSIVLIANWLGGCSVPKGNKSADPSVEASDETLSPTDLDRFLRSVQGHLSRGRMLAAKGNYLRAVETLDGAAVAARSLRQQLWKYGTMPADVADAVHAWYLYAGWSSLKAGNLEQALQRLREAESIDSNDFSTLYNLGVALAKQGKYLEAEKKLHRAIDVSSGRSVLRLVGADETYAANFDLGIVYLETNRAQLAADQFRAALARGGNEAPIYSSMSAALLRLDRVEDAAQYAQKALDRNPTYARAHYNLACALARSGRDGQALEALQLAVRNEPELRRSAVSDGDLESLRSSVRFAAIVEP